MDLAKTRSSPTDDMASYSVRYTDGDGDGDVEERVRMLALGAQGV